MWVVWLGLPGFGFPRTRWGPAPTVAHLGGSRCPATVPTSGLLHGNGHVAGSTPGCGPAGSLAGQEMEAVTWSASVVHGWRQEPIFGETARGMGRPRDLTGSSATVAEASISRTAWAVNKSNDGRSLLGATARRKDGYLLCS